MLYADRGINIFQAGTAHPTLDNHSIPHGERKVYLFSVKKYAGDIFAYFSVKAVAWKGRICYNTL
jgi:hypothetical protein